MLPLAKFELPAEVLLAVGEGVVVALIVAFVAALVVPFVGAATKVVVVVVVVPKHTVCAITTD